MKRTILVLGVCSRRDNDLTSALHMHQVVRMNRCCHSAQSLTGAPGGNKSRVFRRSAVPKQNMTADHSSARARRAADGPGQETTPAEKLYVGKPLHPRKELPLSREVTAGREFFMDSIHDDV